MKKKISFIFLSFAAAAALLLISRAFLLFMDVTHYICPTYVIMGVYCPGCGGTRALRALLDGNILLSLRNNPSVILSAIWCSIVYIRLLINAFTGKIKKIIPGNKIFYIIAAGILIIFYVLRNFIPALKPV